MTYPRKKKGYSWFWANDGHDLMGFAFLNKQMEHSSSIFWNHGPFDTFQDAKKDAIAWFKTDKFHAEMAIFTIKHTRERDVE